MNQENLSKKVLQEKAPSIFQKGHLKGLSHMYSQYNTERIMKDLNTLGWKPVQAIEMPLRVRVRQRQGYQPHMVVFQNENISFSKYKKEMVPQIVLTNSHDGFKSLKLQFGLLRFICQNGLIVFDEKFKEMKVIHKYYTMNQLEDKVYGYVSHIPKLVKTISDFKEIELSEKQKNHFAKDASEIRWVNAREPKLLLNAHRPEDQKNDLWHVYNNVQENIIKGGVKSIIKNEDGTTRNTTSKAVVAIDAITYLNSMLWDLASKYAKKYN